MNMKSKVKVVLKAGEILDGTTVTKLKGTTLYTLKIGLKIYSEDGVQVIGDNSVFLVGERGSINLVSPEVELIAYMTPHDIMELFDN